MEKEDKINRLEFLLNDTKNQISKSLDNLANCIESIKERIVGSVDGQTIGIATEIQSQKKDIEDLKKDVADIKKTLSDINKYRWIVYGVLIAVGFIISNISDIFNLIKGVLIKKP